MSIEDTILPPPEWVISTPGGKFICEHCSHICASQKNLDSHIGCVHFDLNEVNYILYFECSGSIEGRNDINNKIPFNSIDCTGGQCACEDGDINEFGRAVKDAAEELDLELGLVCRMPDPGLGLMFPTWLANLWIENNIINLPETEIKSMEV